MIQTIKNFFKSSWNIGFEINPYRWRMLARVSAFNSLDVDVYLVVGPVSLRIDLLP